MQTRAGQSIEDQSMKIIDAEIGEHRYSESEWPVVRRVIHSTADFDFARESPITFHGDVDGGAKKLREGAPIVADVHGVTGLLSSRHIAECGNKVVCRVLDKTVAQKAKSQDTTRSRMAMRESLKEIDGGVVVIGNAPTALLELLDIVKEGLARPALTVGMPVGFVSAVESKEALALTDLACITNSGRKGGSASAAAILNALFRMS